MKPINPSQATILGADDGPMPCTEQTLLIVDVIDVNSARMPDGTEMRTLSIPTMGGQRVYIIPITADYAHDLARRLARGGETVKPLVPDGAEIDRDPVS